MRAAPDALLDDGLLDVVVIEQRQQAALPRADPAEGLQGHPRASCPACTCSARAEVAISADRPFTMYADGDPIGELPAARARRCAGAVTRARAPGDGAAGAGAFARRPSGAAGGR